MDSSCTDLTDLVGWAPSSWVVWGIRIAQLVRLFLKILHSLLLLPTLSLFVPWDLSIMALGLVIGLDSFGLCITGTLCVCVSVTTRVSIRVVTTCTTLVTFTFVLLVVFVRTTFTDLRTFTISPPPSTYTTRPIPIVVVVAMPRSDEGLEDSRRMVSCCK